MLRVSTDSRANLFTLKKEVLKLVENCNFIQPPASAVNSNSALNTNEIAYLSTLLLLVGVKMLSIKPTFENILNLYDQLYNLTPSLFAQIFKPSETLFDELLISSNKILALTNSFDTSLLGYIYQYFCLPIRKHSQKHIELANKSFKLRETITFTQLYTPPWVIDFLLQNTIMSQWQDKKSKIKIIDPACGSGHFLLRAFDLLYELYLLEGYRKEEIGQLIIGKNIYGADIDPIALFVSALSLYVKLISSISNSSTSNSFLTSNSFSSDLKLNLALAQEVVDMDEPMLGSLYKNWPNEHILSNKYNVVVTNPPYIGRKLLDRRLKQKLKETYPDAHQDLCAAFIKRGLDLLENDGKLGYIAQSSLLFLPTYKKLRENIIEENHLACVVDAGTQVFPLEVGEKINSALFVIGKGKKNDSNNTLFFDISNTLEKEEKLSKLLSGTSNVDRHTNISADVYEHLQSNFKEYPNLAFNYKFSKKFIELFNKLPKIASCMDVKQGLATTDNKRFIRYWWEVDKNEIGKRWFPYAKGAGSERWYAPIETVVDWENDGAAIKETVAKAYPYLKGNIAWVVKNEQYYFKEGLTFSFVNTKNLSVRRLPAGCIFDVGGSGLFALNSLPDFGLDFYMAYLNSSVAGVFAQLINPTLNYQVGDVKQIPILPLDNTTKEKLANIAKKCLELKQKLLRFSLTAINANQPQELTAIINGGNNVDFNKIWTDISLEQRKYLFELESLESQIDDLIFAAIHNNSFFDLETINELKALSLKQVSKRISSPIFPVSKKDFAKLVVFHCLKSKIEMEISNTIELALEMCIEGDLEMSIEQALEMPVDKYIETELDKDQNKWFYKSPMIKSSKKNN
jgi:type I restriction-modification system DNA methylase subunit